MGQPWGLLAAIVLLALVCVPFTVFLLTYLRFRAAQRLLGPLLCPRRRERACVSLDALYAGVTAAFGGRPRLRVGRCSLWSARRECGQECVALPEEERETIRDMAAPPAKEAPDG